MVDPPRQSPSRPDVALCSGLFVPPSVISGYVARELIRPAYSRKAHPSTIQWRDSEKCPGTSLKCSLVESCSDPADVNQSGFQLSVVIVVDVIVAFVLSSRDKTLV